jgi:hypothetical protein
MGTVCGDDGVDLSDGEFAARNTRAYDRFPGRKSIRFSGVVRLIRTFLEPEVYTDFPESSKHLPLGGS